MTDFEEKLKAFRLDEPSLIQVMSAAHLTSDKSEDTHILIVETVIISDGQSTTIRKEESNV